MESESSRHAAPDLYPLNSTESLDGTTVILSLIEVTSALTIVRTRSEDYLNPLESRIQIKVRDDAGGTYVWHQAIGGGGSLADVRSDVFNGTPGEDAKLLTISISIEGKPGLSETLVDLTSPFTPPALKNDE